MTRSKKGVGERRRLHQLGNEFDRKKAQRIVEGIFNKAALEAEKAVRPLVEKTFRRAQEEVPELEELLGECMGATLVKMSGESFYLCDAEQPALKELYVLLEFLGDYREAYTLYDKLK